MTKPAQQKKNSVKKTAKKVPKSSASAKSLAAKKAAISPKVKHQTKPKIEIDLKEVERLAGLGLTQEEIAISLGISEATFYRRKGELIDLRDAIKKGQLKSAVTVANALFELCKAKNLGAIIWFEKTRRGISDKFSLDIDLKELSDDELNALIKKLGG